MTAYNSEELIERVLLQETVTHKDK